MRFGYLVKHNGTYYPAGSDVPISEKPEEKATEKADKPYTKTDIAHMTTAELKELAEKQGIENVQEMSGAKLKVILAEHFEL